jgi:cell division transport system permease protein
MRTWLRHQKSALRSALTRLAVQPLTGLLTALAMGVAISLPAGLYLALGDIDRLAGALPAQPEISVFVADEATPAQEAALATRLRQSDIAHARRVDKDTALATLSAAQDMADVTAGLPANPLPNAWVVQPKDRSRSALTQLAAELKQLSGVDETHVDSQWAERLTALLAIGQTGVWLLAALFAVALVAISGNAIRAQVLTRRDEILVSRLIGATDRHIRRPFLYVGALQGLLGGLAAVGVLAAAGALLQAPVAHLASLYGSAFHLGTPTPGDFALFLGLPTLFGWIGAWLSVARALTQVQGSH